MLDIIGRDKQMYIMQKFDFQIIFLYIADRTACSVLTHSPSTTQIIINIVCFITNYKLRNLVAANKSPTIRYPY